MGIEKITLPLLPGNLVFYLENKGNKQRSFKKKELSMIVGLRKGNSKSAVLTDSSKKQI
jgi:hypothetical protein